MQILPGTYWQHNKTGNVYVIIQVVLNTTNAQDGQQLVVYTARGPAAAYAKVFAREKTEFLAKFSVYYEQ